MGMQGTENSLRVGMTKQEAYGGSKKLLKQFVKADSKGNNDGILAADEFAAFYQKCKPNEVEMFPGLKIEDCTTKNLKKFKKFDTNNNGELSEEELSSSWKAFWNGNSKGKKALLAFGAIAATLISVACLLPKNGPQSSFYDSLLDDLFTYGF